MLANNALSVPSHILNGSAEDIVIEAVVVFELAFRDVEREIFAANLMVAADNRPFENRPETFNRIRVNRTNDVALGGMMHSLVIVVRRQAAIDAAFVGCEQTNLGRNCLAHELFGVLLGNGLKDAGNDAALTAHRADDRDFGCRGVFAAAPALVPVLILVLATDVGFINLDNAAEFLFRLDQCGADLVAHTPSGLVAAETHETHNLEGAHSLFACQGCLTVGRSCIKEPTMSLESLTQNLEAAFAQAAKERDTWKCPECGDLIDLPGQVHIEWGNPECGECRKSGKVVLRTLIAITGLP